VWLVFGIHSAADIYPVDLQIIYLVRPRKVANTRLGFQQTKDTAITPKGTSALDHE
jgi:hypothetical protein